MKRYLLILPVILSIGCASAFGQQAVRYAMSAWETLDEAFFSWAIVQPNIVEYLMNEGKEDEAKQVFATFKSAVGRWVKIKDEIETVLVKAAKAGKLDSDELNNLFDKARSLLHEVGALRKVPI